MKASILLVVAICLFAFASSTTAQQDLDSQLRVCGNYCGPSMFNFIHS
jgi:hypothetical protein